MSQEAQSSFPPSPETSRATSRLERHVEWSTGFWLAYVFTRSQLQARLLEERIQIKLAEHAKQQRVLRPSTPMELETILEQLLAPSHPPCTWVEAVAEDSPAGDPGWASAWTSFILRANERRELLRSSLAEGLVLVAPTSLKSKLRTAGPDLWSVRTFVFELPPSLEEQRETILRAHAAGEPDRPRGFVDPVLVESDVRRLSRAHQGQAQPTAADALTLGKLAERLLSVGRYDEAFDAYNRAVAAHRSSREQRPEAPSLDLAKSLMGLGDAAYRDGRHAEAERAYSEAIGMLQAVHGTRVHADIAASLHGLANVLDVQGRHDEAGRAYRESIEIAERMQGDGDEPVTEAIRDYTAALATREGDGQGSIDELIDELARVLHEPEAREIVLRAGFPAARIPSFKSPVVFWWRVVEEAKNGIIAGGAQTIIDEVAKMYPGNAFFAAHRSR